MTVGGSAEAPSGELLFTLMESFVTGFAVTSAADLGIADALAGGPRTAEEVALAISAHGPSVHRLLRVLGGAGIVTEAQPNRFALTPLGASLQTPGSLRPALQILSKLVLPTLAEIGQSVRTGEPVFERLFGAPFYDYLTNHPEDEQMFGQTMRVMRAYAGPITEAFDFTGVRTLVDVGGGQGWRTIEVLQAHPDVRGILFDRPNVVELARAALAEAGLAGRREVVGGTFFEGVPEGGDCYLLSGVLPNWDDPQALTILRNCRRAMPDDGRLLVFEPVLSEGDQPHLGKALDLVMLAILGGRLRTGAEHEKLFDAAGFRGTRMRSSDSPFVVVKAIPV